MFKIGDRVLLRTHYNTSSKRKLTEYEYPVGFIGVIEDVDFDKCLVCFECSPWYSMKDIEHFQKQRLINSNFKIYTTSTVTILEAYGKKVMLSNNDVKDLKDCINEL